MNDSTLDDLTTILQRLGAEKDPARVMATQLLKRADQLANERSVSQAEALDYLLKVTIAGKEGRVYEGVLPENGTTMRDQRREKG